MTSTPAPSAKITISRYFIIKKENSTGRQSVQKIIQQPGKKLNFVLSTRYPGGRVRIATICSKAGLRLFATPSSIRREDRESHEQDLQDRVDPEEILSDPAVLLPVQFLGFLMLVEFFEIFQKILAGFFHIEIIV